MEKENDLSKITSVFKEKKYSINESPELYDTYSDLNLFLSKKIKKEMQYCGSSKKWTIKIQEELIEKITPDFRKKFPQYHLGVSALKKAWEKIAYYSQYIPQEKEAIDQNGNLKPYFLIRENLKNGFPLNHQVPLHPKCLAHQLAIKIRECLATVNGEKSPLDYLTKTIWSMQQHLIPKEKVSAENILADVGDPIDCLIVKISLDWIAKDPTLSAEELKINVRETLFSLRELPHFSSMGSLEETVAALLAEKLYAHRNSNFGDFARPSTLSFLALKRPLSAGCRDGSTTEKEVKNPKKASEDREGIFDSERDKPKVQVNKNKSSLYCFIQRHSAFQKMGDLSSSFEWIRRIRSLYLLGLKLPKTLTEKEVKSAVLATYPSIKVKRPDLPQSVYAFISAELLLMRSSQRCHCPDEVAKQIWAAYQEVIYLPDLIDPQDHTLDLLLWKTLSDSKHLLKNLPYRVGLRIEEELARVLIENPQRSFSCLVRLTVESFEKVQELMRIKKWEEIEQKVDLWTVQGDLLHSLVSVDQELSLFQRICQHFQKREGGASHHLLINEVCQEHLREHPELTSYSEQLFQRTQVLYKCAWYTLFSSPQESAYERFLKWHTISFQALWPQLDYDRLLRKLKAVVDSKLPLIPFESFSDRLLLNATINTRLKG